MRQLRLPLSPRTRQRIEEYLRGLKLGAEDHAALVMLRKRLREVDLDQIEKDLALLRQFLATRRRA